jgi:ribosomal protein L25 (general stress protein Ctc)
MEARNDGKVPAIAFGSSPFQNSTILHDVLIRRSSMEACNDGKLPAIAFESSPLP